MLRFGQKEIDAFSRVARSGQLFRYREGGECEKFEKRFAGFLNARYVTLTASGTAALSAALIGLGIGPGDEVIVPAHTYMSSAVAVLSVGAIPVIVDMAIVYEADVADWFDMVVVVDALVEKRKAWLSLGRAWCGNEIENRMASQMAVMEKRKRADEIIENDGTLEDLARKASLKYHEWVVKSGYHLHADKQQEMNG